MLAVVTATTFGDRIAPARAVPTPVSDVPVHAGPAEQLRLVDVVLGFGDLLGELHSALGFEPAERDGARVERACAAVVADYPRLRQALGDSGHDLLVAAESMVDACRRGFAAALDDGGFEIVDGDYLAYRELSFAFTG